ncbi:MAG: hypothetical protein Q8L69_03545, partial [Gallionellaceae bacterium]|nr:hypothetical protein [Gallionellaceae bacterium]
VTILRSSQGKQHPISLNEAVSAAKGIEGWSYSENPPTFEYSNAEGTCALWYQDGELWTKNPEKWCINAMLVLARRLEARVRGDEWETYDADKTYLHADDISLRAEEEFKSKALLSSELKQQRFIRNAIIGFFVVLGIIGFLIGKWFENH